MKNRYTFAVAMLPTLLVGAGCGGGSQTVTPPPPVLAITLSTAPPATLAASGQASLIATVTNDSANAGVDWSCSPAGACGTFNPAHTASGAATTYTAPSAAGNVTIVAAATSKSSTTASAAVTITATAPALTVTLSTAPPTSLAVNATASVAATVANDTANAGVDWSCAPVGTCGSFSSPHTASGTATTYTAPAAAASVTITAASTTTNTITASAPVNIVVGTATLSGNFTFFAGGMEANSRLFSLAGVATLTAAGTVTGGEQDFNDGTSANKSPAAGDQITGGAYTLGADGRGTLTLITNNTNLGAAGTETFSIVMVNSKHLLIESFDSTATSSGSMDLQSTALGTLSGGYSFAVLGKNGTTTEDFGGVITITGSGTLHDAIDSNEGGTASSGSSTGTFTVADASGRGTIAFGGNTFVYYAVVADSTGTRTEVFRLIVTNTNETDIGSAFAQATGATFSLATIQGKYVLLENGNHGNASGFIVGGQFVADGAGNVTSGFADESEGGTPPNDLTSGAITGTYTMPSTGLGSLTITWTADHHARGVFPVDPSINLLDPNNATGSSGAIVLSTDEHVGDGILVQQTSTTAPSGNFAISLHAYTNAGEADGVGQVSIAANGAVSGLAEVNDLFHTTQASGATFTGTLIPDGANPGRYTMAPVLTVNGTPTTQTIIVYQISSSQLVFVQTDTAQFATGVLELQQ